MRTVWTPMLKEFVRTEREQETPVKVILRRLEARFGLKVSLDALEGVIYNHSCPKPRPVVTSRIHLSCAKELHDYIVIVAKRTNLPVSVVARRFVEAEAKRQMQEANEGQLPSHKRAFIGMDSGIAPVYLSPTIGREE